MWNAESKMKKVREKVEVRTFGMISPCHCELRYRQVQKNCGSCEEKEPAILDQIPFSSVIMVMAPKTKFSGVATVELDTKRRKALCNTSSIFFLLRTRAMLSEYVWPVASRKKPSAAYVTRVVDTGVGVCSGT